MPANDTFTSSLFRFFSTFLDNSRLSDHEIQEMKEVFAVLVEKNPQINTWNKKQIAHLLKSNSKTHHIDISTTQHILTQFVHQFRLHQTNMYLHEFLLALKRDGCSYSTIKNYRSDISQFLSFSNKTILSQAITKPKIESFVWYQKQKGLKLSSIQRKLKSLNQFVQWLHVHQIADTYTEIDTDPKAYLQEEDASLPQEKTLHTKNTSHFISQKNQKPKTPHIYFTPQETRLADALKKQERRFQTKKKLWHLSQKIRVQTKQLSLTYLNLVLILLFFVGLAVFGYRQFFKNVEQQLAYPASLTKAGRVLSFQGRLTDTAQNPITTSTNTNFKLFDSGPSTTGGAELWDSGTCSITPDQDGIFSTGLGDDCGSEIPNNVFTENANVWLQVSVAGETLSPRQPIRTVAYAINAETLQGYPASASAVESTVVVMDENGEVVFGNLNPVLKATGDSFTIDAQTLTIQTTTGSDGDVVLSPDGLGEIIAESYLYAPGATLSATYADGVPLTIKGGPSSATFLTEWQQSDGTTLSVIDQNGYLGLGTNNPSNLLQIGNPGSIAGSLSIAGSSSGLVSIDTAADAGTWTFTLPTSGGTNGFILQTDGSGNTSWLDPTGLGYSLYQVTIGTSDADIIYSGDIGADINTAISAAPLDGVEIFIKAGDYNLSTPINWKNKSNLHLIGAAMEQVTITANLTSNRLVDGRNTTLNALGTPHRFKSSISGITFDNTSQSNSGSIAIDMDWYSDVNIRDVTIRDVETAIQIKGGSFFNSLSNVKIEDSEYGVVMDQSTGSHSITDKPNSNTFSQVKIIDTTYGVTITKGNQNVFIASQIENFDRGIYIDDNGNSVTNTRFESNDNPSTVTYVDLDTNAFTNQFTGNYYSGNDWVDMTSSIVDSSGDNSFIELNSYKDPFVRQVRHQAAGTDTDDFMEFVRKSPGGTAALLKLSDLYAGSGSPTTLEIETERFGGKFISGIRQGTENFFVGALGDGYLASSFGIGTTSPSGLLQLGTPGTTAGDVSLAGSTSGLVTIDTAAAAGTWSLTLPTSGGTNGYVLQTDGSGNTSWVAQAGGSGESYWGLADGALSPVNSTTDLLVGGSASDSAKFAFLNVNSGTPTASVSGSVAGAATYFTGDGTIATTMNRDLLINPSGGNVGIGTSSPTQLLTINGTSRHTESGVPSEWGDIYKDSSYFNIESLDRLKFIANGIETLTIDTAGDFNFNNGDVYFSNSSGRVGIGTASPSHTLQVYDTTLAPQIRVTGAANSDAVYPSLGLYENTGTPNGFELKYLGASDRLAITNQIDTEWMTILRSSGYVGIDSTNPQAELDVDGDFIVSGTTQFNNQTYSWPGSQTLNYVLSTDGSGNLSWSDPIALSGGANYWTVTNEQVHPKNAEWHDLLIGGTSTSSAQFIVQADNGDTTVRGNLNTSSLSALDATGLTIYDDGSTPAIFVEDGGFVGISSTNPSVELEVAGDFKLSGSTEFNNIAYTWPGSQGNGFILQTDGSGTLSWADPNVLTASATYWDRTDEQVHPKNALWNDLMVGGTSTASARFYVQANTGEVYVGETLGIGTTEPSTKLDVTAATKGKALAIFNESGDQNILTASASGTTKLSLTRDGTLQLGTPYSGQSNMVLYSADGTSDAAITFDHGTAGRVFEIGHIMGDNSYDFGIGNTNGNKFLTVDWSTGYIAIGTTDASRRLEVYGGNGILINQDNTDYISISAEDNATVFDANSGYFDFRPNDNTYGLMIRQNNDTGDWGNIVVGETYVGLAKNNTTPQLVAEDGGNIGIGTTDPSTLLQLGTSGSTAGTLSLAGTTSGLVTIDTAAAAGTWTLTLPTSSGSNNYVLTTDGSGNSTWADPSIITAGSNYWLQTNEQIYPKNALWQDLLIGGTSTASAHFIVQGNTGDVIVRQNLNVENIRALDSDGLSMTDDSGNLGLFIEDGGYIGIGTNNPSNLLQIGSPGVLGGTVSLAGSTSGLVTIDAAADAGTWTFTLPITSGSSNYILTTDGNGNTTWSDPNDITAGSNYWLQTGEQIYPKNALWHDLVIGGTSTASATFYAQANTGEVFIGNRLGIGTTDPGAEMEIAGSIKVPNFDTIIYNDPNQSGAAGGDGFRMSFEENLFGATQDALIFEKTDSNNSYPDGGIIFANRGSSGVRYTSFAIRGDGDIGIGTENPARKLDLYGDKRTFGALSSQFLIADTSTYNTNPLAGIQFSGKYNSSGDYTGFGGIASGKENTTDGNTSSYLAFYSRENGNNISEAMRINSSGYLGINTTSPSEELDIVGDFRVTGTTEFNGITYTWPATQVNNYILQTDGSGNLAWVDPTTLTASTNYWQVTGQQIHPKNQLWHDLLLGGSSTSSATVALQANTGIGLFSGGIGIGTTNPGSLLQIGDPGNTAGTLSLAGSSSGLVTIDTAADAGTWTFTLPIDTGTNGYLMQTDGSGNTSWMDPSSLSGYWNLTNEQIHPKNTLWRDLAIGGNSTSSARFHIAADTGAFTLRDNSLNDIFTINETQMTSHVPANFLAAGDVSMAYDLIFTNQTSSYIKTNAPLYIETGENFESNDLTLRTYNSGDIVFDAPGGLTSAQAQNWDLAANTSALNIESGLLNVDTTNTRIGINTTTPSEALDVVGNFRTTGTTEFNGIAYTWPASQTTSYLLQTNGSGSLSWVDPSTLSGTSYWNLTNEQLHPNNALWTDLMIGGTSTASATFFAQADTGNGFFGGNVGIGTTSPSTLLQLGDAGTTAGTLSLAGGTSGLVTIDTAAAAGTWTFTLPTSAGTNGYLLQTDGSGNSSWIDPSTLGGSSYWQLSDGALSPLNSTTDVLIGGTATSSAKFGILNVNNGIPVASLSAGISGGTYLTANGILQTTNNQALTIGGNTTGNISFFTDDLFINKTTGFIGIGTNSPIAHIDFESGQNTGTALAVSSDSLSTGTGFSLNSNSSASDLSSGTLLDLTETSTYTDSTNRTGITLNVERDITLNHGSPGTQPITEGGNSSEASVLNSNTLSFSHTVPANNNRILIVAVTSGDGGSNGPEVSSVTFNSTSLTRLATGLSGFDITHTYLYYLVNPTATTANIVVTADESASDIAAIAVNYYNVDQSTPFDTPQTTSGGTGGSRTFTYNADAGDMLVDVFGNAYNTNPTMTAGSGQTEVEQIQSGDDANVAHSYKAAVAGSNTTSYSASGNYSGYISVAMNQATSGGSDFQITGTLANFSSDCTETSGICGDSSMLVNINQQFSSATGTVLNIANSGNGNSLAVNTTEFVIDSDANVGIGTSSPGTLLQLGDPGATTGTLSLAGSTSGLVTIDTAAAAGTWSLTLPTSGGTNGYVLQTDGSGNTSWIDPSVLTASTNYWTLTNEQIHPKNALWHDLLLGSSSTSSATVALQANTGNITSQGQLNIESIAALDSDGLSLYDDGGNGIFIEDEGYVGVGTTNPQFLLDVQGSNTNQMRIQVTSDQDNKQASYFLENSRGSLLSYGGNFYGGTGYVTDDLFGSDRADRYFVVSGGTNNLGMFAGTLTAQPFVLGTNNVERLRVTSTGNVGIGTTAPGAKLQINTGATTTIGQIIKAAPSQTANLQEWQDSSGAALTVVDASGRLGVGTDDPAYLIEASGDTGAEWMKVGSTAANGNSGFRMSNDAQEWAFYTGSDDTFLIGDLNASRFPFIIEPNATTNSLRIDTSGNIGINSSNPSSQFFIKGVTDQVQQIIQANSTQTANLTEWQDSGGAALTVVDKNGNVGIGTTSPGAVLDVKGNMILGANTTNTTLTKYGNTSGDEFYVGTNGALRIQRSAGGSETFRSQVNGDSQGRFLINSSGYLLWGSGSAAQDTNLYRSAANTLKTDDAFDIGSTLDVGGNVTVTGHVLPSADDTYDLGSSSNRWRDLYLGPTTLHLGSSTTDEGLLSYDTTNNIFAFTTDSTTNGDISFFNGDLFLDKSISSVGVGTDTPTAKLHVYDNTFLSSTDGSEQEIFRAHGNSGNQDYLRSFLDREGSGSDWTSAVWKLQRQVDSSSMGYLEFGDWNDDLISFGEGNTEYMRIDGDGNVGIGATSLTEKLHINGAMVIGTTTTDTTGAIRWTGSDFEGYTGSSWQSFTSGGGTATDLNCTGCVSNSELKTTTGSTSGFVGTGGTVSIGINDYSFTPNLRLTGTGGSGPSPITGLSQNVTGTTGRFALKEGTNCCSNTYNYAVQWRYVTASRAQELFAWFDTSEGIIRTMYASEIPDGANGELPVDIENVDPNWIPIQATIFDPTLVGLGKEVDTEDLLRNYTFTEYELASNVDLASHSLTSAKNTEREQCLIDNDNDESKCFQFLNHPSVYYGKLEPCADCAAKHDLLDAEQAATATNPDTGADLAEMYTNINQTDTPQAGEVVSVDENGIIVKSQKPYCQSTLGVISTSPGQVLRPQDDGIAIALSGRVPVKVSPTSSSIKPGDPLTSSYEDGKAIKANKSGKIIGTALEAWTPSSKKDSIMMFVNTSWYDPDVFLTDTGEYTITKDETIDEATPMYTLKDSVGETITRIGKFSSAVIANLKAGLINTQQLLAQIDIKTPKLETDLITPFEGESVTVQLNASSSAQFEIENSNEKTVASINSTGDARFSGTVSAPISELGKLLANEASISGTLHSNSLQSERISGKSARVELLESRIAQLEEIKATTAEIATATISGILYANDIDGFEDKVATALQEPSLLEVLLNEQNRDQETTDASPSASTTDASVASLFNIIDQAGFEASGSGILNKSLDDLELETDDVSLGATAVFVNKYFEVNGIGYISDSLGIGQNLLIGQKTRIADGIIEFDATTPEDTLSIQPSGKGRLAFMNNLVLLDETGLVTINGDAIIAGKLEVEDTLLTSLLQPSDFGNPFQVQVAGAATESGDIKESRFEIINEIGTPVATISAQGRANFAGGLGIGAEDLSQKEDTEINTDKTSGKATIKQDTNQVVIKSKLITENSLIYVTPIGSTGNQVIYVKEQQTENTETDEKEGQFTVGFDENVTKDVQFNWWIVN